MSSTNCYPACYNINGSYLQIHESHESGYQMIPPNGDITVSRFNEWNTILTFWLHFQLPNKGISNLLPYNGDAVRYFTLWYWVQIRNFTPRPLCLRLAVSMATIYCHAPCLECLNNALTRKYGFSSGSSQSCGLSCDWDKWGKVSE